MDDNQNNAWLNVVGWAFFIILCFAPFTWQSKFLIFLTVCIFGYVTNRIVTRLERTNWLLLLLFNLQEDDDKRMQSIDKSKEEVMMNLTSKQIENQLMGESGVSFKNYLFLFGLMILIGFIFYLTTNFQDFIDFLDSI